MLALGSEDIPDPPAAFGVIRPRLVGIVGTIELRDSDPPTFRHENGKHFSANSRTTLEKARSSTFSRALSVVAVRSDDSSSDCSVTRSHRGPVAPEQTLRLVSTRSSNRVSRMGSPTIRRLAVSNDGSLDVVRGFVYPEWDVHLQRYRPEWCTVVELEPEDGDRSRIPAGNTRSLRRALARLGTELERHRRQPQGEDLDLDAAVDSYVEVRADSFPDDAIYIESQRSRRDLSVLVLLDISGSAGEPSGSGGIVHDHQLSAAADLTAALHEVGDRVALYGFRSQGRSAVHIFPVKRFDDSLSTLTESRLGGLRPGGFTRLGAAIRHGVSTLEREGGTGRRLLVVLSDGFAYDHGYEGSYGEADARRALSEARHRGIGCLCLSIASTTDAEALRRVFGTAAYAAFGTRTTWLVGSPPCSVPHSGRRSSNGDDRSESRGQRSGLSIERSGT